MPIVIGGSSGRPVVSGCAWEPRVTQPETFVEGRREILRQASIALGGRPVTVWEVSARAELEPQASSEPAPTHHTTKLDVDATLRRWNIAIVQGSRWVGCQGAADGFWVVAPVRTRPPAPPPEGRERRSRERLTLELAGLCLGLLDRREPTPGHPPAARSDPLNDITTLPGIIAHELSNPLTAARAGLHLAMESLGRWTEVAAGRRLELLDELGQVVEDIDRSASFLRAVKDRARGALARSERFDAVRVVRSCCTLESRVLKEKRIPLEFDSTLETVYLKGDPNALYALLVHLIRDAADASAARPAPIRVGAASHFRSGAHRRHHRRRRRHRSGVEPLTGDGESAVPDGRDRSSAHRVGCRAPRERLDTRALQELRAGRQARVLEVWRHLDARADPGTPDGPAGARRDGRELGLGAGYRRERSRADRARRPN